MKVEPRVAEEWLLAHADQFQYRYDRSRPDDGVEGAAGEVFIRIEQRAAIGPWDNYTLHWLNRIIDVPILPKRAKKRSLRRWLKEPAQ